VPADLDRQAIPGEFVNEREQTQAASVMRPSADEVFAPDVVGILRS